MDYKILELDNGITAEIAVDGDDVQSIKLTPPIDLTNELFAEIIQKLSSDPHHVQ